MNRFQLEKIYEAHQIGDYRLHNLEELYTVHGVDLYNIKGYQDLSLEKQELFSEFILNFYNAQGMDIRATLVPKAIYWAEEIDLRVGHELIGTNITAISKSGKRKRIHTYRDTKDKYRPDQIEKSKPRFYLRFELRCCGHAEWFHVLSNGEWY